MEDNKKSTTGASLSSSHGLSRGSSSQLRQISNRRLPPFPGKTHVKKEANSGFDSKEPTSESVRDFLKTHGAFLEEYILSQTSLEQLEIWVTKKKDHLTKSTNPSSECHKKTLYGCLDIYNIQTNIKSGINKLDRERLSTVYDIANTLGTATQADGCALYSIKSSKNELYLYVPPIGDSDGSLQLCGHVADGTTVAAHVAKSRKSVLITDLMQDDRFPKGIGVESNLVQSVLCVPFLLSEKDVLCVFQFSRNWDKTPFTAHHLEVVSGFVAWAGTAVSLYQMNDILRKQTRLNKYLLEVSKMIFDDVVDIDLLVKKIMTYTKELVHADRCALFLVDEGKHELYANMFDDGRVKDGKPVFAKKEIRFSMEKGIAGYVSKTGEIINIPDAYKDPRFNREIDKQTGYTTRNILCMPIVSKGLVIGVVQMVNKVNGDCFTETDENAFKMFAVYCALGLHYSKLYTDSQMKSAQYQVALEVISYHATSVKEDMEKMVTKPYPKHPIPDIDSLYFYGPASHEMELPQIFVSVCVDLFGPNCFDMNKLCRFILTVKKNYRPIAYHNWHHGWNVAHCMYAIMKKVKQTGCLSDIRMKALLFASLCHDLDHRGYNNAWFKKFDQPMAALYPTSVMEQHHYNIAVRILQEEEHNIFSDMNTEDYKMLLKHMRHAILATDLTLYFGVQKDLAKLTATGTLDLQNEDHLNTVTSLMVTGCDLSACCKRWGDAYKVALDVMEEFYIQGDEEKKKGVTPLPMMDRDNKSSIPQDQIGFIKFVCVPCYQTLSDIFPDTIDLLEGCRNNQDQWQRIHDGKTTGFWEPDKSVASNEENKN